jgi:hypothetical protein
MAGSTGIGMPSRLDFHGTSPFTLEVWASQTAYTPFGEAFDHDDYVGAPPG